MAVKTDICQLCGPYLLYERCLSEGKPSHGKEGCIPGWQAKPGWTNDDMHGYSQYVGDNAVLGHSSGPDYPDVADKLSWHDKFQDQADMAGISEAPESADKGEGLCGSWVTDGPQLNSIFYFHHYE